MTNAHGDGPWLGVIGDIVEDVVVFATAPFAAASDTPARIVRRRGGSAANVAVAASSLVATRFIGCVGDDPTGRQLAKTMPGVDVRLQITHQPTGTIVVLVDAAGERHMFPDRGANVHMGALAPGWLDGLFALHATAYSLETGSTADVVMAAFRQANLGVTSLDASSHALIRQIGVESFVGLIDQADPVIVFANADEAALLGWDVQQPSPQRVVIVKHGASPALIRTPRGAWLVPVPRLDVDDTTGAGDAFAAGVLSRVVTQQMGRQNLLSADAATAVALAQAGHVNAAAWLS